MMKPSPATPERVDTPLGPLEYQLTRKKVRNLNLRVRADGSVAVSAPRRMPKGEIERFLVQKAAWVLGAQAKVACKAPREPCRCTKEECLALFTPVFEAAFPAFADALGGKLPGLKVRDMKSRWGVCHIQKRYITLNMRLAEKPREALEYVVLHEYVHFLHPNHGPAFHAEMARRMPDYRQRRKLLK